MKRNLNDSDEEFSLDVPNPDDEFTLDLPEISPPSSAGPAPVNTRGEVVHHQARPLSVAEQILPRTQPDPQIVRADYGKTGTGYESGSAFSSETVITAILIWNTLLNQGGFPLEVLELIFNYTIQVFHFLENAVYVVCTEHPISVTSMLDPVPKTHYFRTNPITLWDGRGTREREKARNNRYMTSPASNLASFPFFLTMVFDNIVTLDKHYQRNQTSWKKWHLETQKILKTPKNFGGIIPKGVVFSHYYVSAGEMIMTYNSPGVQHYIAIFDAPQTNFFLRRTDGTNERYQFNPYGPRRRLFLTVIVETEEARAGRILPGYNSIATVPRMEHLRELYGSTEAGRSIIGGRHEDKTPKFFTFYSPM
jgi:hypothetical protein